MKAYDAQYADALEKIRFSITRLKLVFESPDIVKCFCTWKDKILDYEIETRQILKERFS